MNEVLSIPFSHKLDSKRKSKENEQCSLEDLPGKTWAYGSPPNMAITPIPYAAACRTSGCLSQTELMRVSRKYSWYFNEPWNIDKVPPSKIYILVTQFF